MLVVPVVPTLMVTQLRSSRLQVEYSRDHGPQRGFFNERPPARFPAFARCNKRRGLVAILRTGPLLLGPAAFAVGWIPVQSTRVADFAADEMIGLSGGELPPRSCPRITSLSGFRRQSIWSVLQAYAARPVRWEPTIAWNCGRCPPHRYSKRLFRARVGRLHLCGPNYMACARRCSRPTYPAEVDFTDAR